LGEQSTIPIFVLQYVVARAIVTPLLNVLIEIAFFFRAVTVL